jgi:hypothetical protein
VQLEHLLETRDVIFGLLKMLLQPGLEVAVGDLADHVGQRFQDLLLGVIDVLKLVHVEIIHGLDVSGKQAHLRLPYS